MQASVFDEAAEVVRSMLPDEYADVRIRSRSYGMKVWFGAAQPTPHHYEAQVIGPQHLDDVEVLAIEIGLHLEDRDLDRNNTVLGSITAAEGRWRRSLGDEPVAGPFIGRPDDWRRVSEIWPDPDLGEPALAFDLGARLVEYVCTLEPFLR